MSRVIILAAIALAALLPTAAAELVSVSIGGQETDITYTTTEVDVLSARVTDTSVLFDVESTGNPGSLVIVLERSVIDTFEQAGERSPFIVLLDAFPIDAVEESDITETSRTLRIPVESGPAEIEIIGDYVGGLSTQPDVAPPVAAEETPEEAPAEPVPEPEAPADAGTGAAEGGEQGTNMPEQAMVDTDDAMPLAQDDMAADDTMMEAMEAMEPEESPACGSGTVLAGDGVTCVLAPQAPVEPVSYRDLAFGAGAGFILSFIIMIVLYGIGRAGRS